MLLNPFNLNSLALDNSPDAILRAMPIRYSALRSVNCKPLRILTLNWATFSGEGNVQIPWRLYCDEHPVVITDTLW